MKDISYLLIPFFDKLNKIGVNYAVCGNYKDLPHFTNHDIDIWTDDINLVESILEKLAEEKGFYLYLKNKTANGSNNLFYYFNNEIQVLHIDLMHETSYRSIFVIVKGTVILNNRVKYKNFYVVNESIEIIMHLIYPIVNFGKIKTKYLKDFENNYRNIKFIDELSNVVGYKLQKTICKLIAEQKWNEIESLTSKIKYKIIYYSIIKDKFFRINYILKTLLLVVRKFIKPAGMFVAFIGIDGSGKSTIIENINEVKKKYFINISSNLFYWRPFLLPPLRKFIFFNKTTKPENINEHGIRTVNLSLLYRAFYLFKFLYYTIDFILGQVKYRYSVMRGDLVLFDRYYYDLLVYPERFGFYVNPFLIKFIQKFIPKPDITFYLDVETNNLFIRKKELSMNEIERQKNLYSKIISQIKTAKIIYNYDKEKTINSVIDYCLAFMHRRLN